MKRISRNTPRMSARITPLQALIKFRNKQFGAEEVVQKCDFIFDQPVLGARWVNMRAQGGHPPKRSSSFD